MRHPALHGAALAAALLLPFAACSDGAGPASGSISVLLTDAPGDVRAAVVTISEIYLQGEGGRVTLRDEPVTTDLVTLANATTTLVADAVVPAGTYTGLRFVITGAYVEVEGEGGGSSIYATSDDYEGLPAGAAVAGPLRTPSLGSSGLKVTLPGAALAVDGGQKILLVDFDVAQSFGHETGQGSGWVMHPVIKGAEVTASGEVIATLRLADGVALPGGATLADIGAVLTNAEGGAESVPFADADGDGVFEAAFRYLLPGEYVLTYAAPAGVALTTDPAAPRELSLAPGALLAAGAVVTGAAGP